MQRSLQEGSGQTPASIISALHRKLCHHFLAITNYQSVSNMSVTGCNPHRQTLSTFLLEWVTCKICTFKKQHSNQKTKTKDKQRNLSSMALH